MQIVKKLTRKICNKTKDNGFKKALFQNSIQKNDSVIKKRDILLSTQCRFIAIFFDLKPGRKATN